MSERKKYDADFKRRIVELVVEKGRTSTEVGLEHDIPLGLVTRWATEYRNGASWVRSAKKLAEDTENATLKKENHDLKKEGVAIDLSMMLATFMARFLLTPAATISSALR